MDLHLQLIPEAFQHQIVRYLDYLKYERGYSPHTIKNYQANLISLTEFFSQQDVSNWRGVDNNVLRIWLVELKKKGLISQ